MTIVEEIIKNWSQLSRRNFDEYMLNNLSTLIRIEKEQIVDAYNEGDTFPQSYHHGDHYYNENYGEKKAQ